MALDYIMSFCNWGHVHRNQTVYGIVKGIYPLNIKISINSSGDLEDEFNITLINWDCGVHHGINALHINPLNQLIISWYITLTTVEWAYNIMQHIGETIISLMVKAPHLAEI